MLPAGGSYTDLQPVACALLRAASTILAMHGSAYICIPPLTLITRPVIQAFRGRSRARLCRRSRERRRRGSRRRPSPGGEANHQRKERAEPGTRFESRKNARIRGRVDAEALCGDIKEQDLALIQRWNPGRPGVFHLREEHAEPTRRRRAEVGGQSRIRHSVQVRPYVPNRRCRRLSAAQNVAYATGWAA
jgi:hypothetical protein